MSRSHSQTKKAGHQPTLPLSQEEWKHLNESFHLPKSTAGEIKLPVDRISTNVITIKNLSGISNDEIIAKEKLHLSQDQEPTASEINSMVRKMSLKTHPDKNASPEGREKFEEDQKARDILITEIEKKKIKQNLHKDLSLNMLEKKIEMKPILTVFSLDRVDIHLSKKITDIVRDRPLSVFKKIYEENKLSPNAILTNLAGGKDSLLCNVVNYQNIEVVQFLLSQNANPNYIVNQYSASALHQLAKGRVNSNSIHLIKLLIANKADPNIRDQTAFQMTPLHAAIKCNNEIIISTLIALGADPLLKTAFGDDMNDLIKDNAKKEQERLLTLCQTGYIVQQSQNQSTESPPKEEKNTSNKEEDTLKEVEEKIKTFDSALKKQETENHLLLTQEQDAKKNQIPDNHLVLRQNASMLFKCNRPSQNFSKNKLLLIEIIKNWQELFNIHTLTFTLLLSNIKEAESVDDIKQALDNANEGLDFDIEEHTHLTLIKNTFRELGIGSIVYFESSDKKDSHFPDSYLMQESEIGKCIYHFINRPDDFNKNLLLNHSSQAAQNLKKRIITLFDKNVKINVYDRFILSHGLLSICNTSVQNIPSLISLLKENHASKKIKPFLNHIISELETLSQERPSPTMQGGCNT